MFDQFLLEFASQLPDLGLTDEEFRLAEQSRLVYLDVMIRKQMASEKIAIASSDEENENTDMFSTENEDNIRKKLKQIKDRARKRAQVEIAKERLLRRKTNASVKSVEKLYPDVGDVMESIAESCDICADKWRRTGVYTFSGDPKKEKRLTFKLLQHKLEEHHGRHFSMGTVVQLYVPRNKQRSLSKRYKGLAHIK